MGMMLWFASIPGIPSVEAMVASLLFGWIFRL